MQRAALRPRERWCWPSRPEEVPHGEAETRYNVAPGQYWAQVHHYERAKGTGTYRIRVRAAGLTPQPLGLSRLARPV